MFQSPTRQPTAFDSTTTALSPRPPTNSVIKFAELPESIQHNLDDWIRAEWKTYRKSNSAIEHKQQVIDRLKEHQVNGTFPTDINWSFSGFGQYPHTISLEDRQRYMTEEKTLLDEVKVKLLQGRIKILESDLANFKASSINIMDEDCIHIRIADRFPFCKGNLTMLQSLYHRYYLLFTELNIQKDNINKPKNNNTSTTTASATVSAAQMDVEGQAPLITSMEKKMAALEDKFNIMLERMDKSIANKNKDKSKKNKHLNRQASGSPRRKQDHNGQDDRSPHRQENKKDKKKNNKERRGRSKGRSPSQKRSPSNSSRDTRLSEYSEKSKNNKKGHGKQGRGRSREKGKGKQDRN